MSVAAAEPSAQPAAQALTAAQEAFVRADLFGRLSEGPAQSRYFSFVLWPVIAAIYWRQIDLFELVPPFAVHIVVTIGFDILRRAFNRARPSDEEVIRWGWWFAGLSFLAGACWGTAGYILASMDYELQRMLLGLVLLATITTAVPIRSAHPPTCSASAAATTAPLLFVLLTASDPFYQLVGIAGGAYVGHLMAYVRDVHRWQYDNIALAYQKEDLARRLQIAYDEARFARDSAIDAQRDAESANQAKSTFLATVSEELGTPMNGVLGMIGVRERSPLWVEQREALGTVRYSASTLLRIIDDILDFSKIEAGRLDLERIELSTVELIEGVAETLAPQAAAKGLKLAAYVAAGVPERVTGDPLRLQQILFNLLGNAIKFTETGSVRLSLEKADEAMLCIKVADTGIRLRADLPARLLLAFLQADTSTTPRFGGTGLGVCVADGPEPSGLPRPWRRDALIRAVARVAGRTVARPSTVGTAAGPSPVLNGHILVVDDNSVNRKILARQLELAGASTDSAAGGEEALELWRKGSYDLVLADLQMPTMHGFELARRIRESEAAERRAAHPHPAGHPPPPPGNGTKRRAASQR